MEGPWHKNFPTPRSNPIRMSPFEVVELLRSPDKRAGKDYIVVDVRRADFGVSTSGTVANRCRSIWYIRQ